MQWLIKLMREKSKLQNELLGKLLRQAREEAGMTQTVAAANLGRDQTFIARIESGSQQATFVEVEQLAQTYGKQLAHFQTIEQIEARDRNHALHYAFRPDAIATYAENLLKKRRRKRKLSSPKQRPRSRKRS